MKKAYFVMGAESAGNRMMTRAIESVGDFGIGGISIFGNGHEYIGKWNTEKSISLSLMKNCPSQLLYVRSVPHGGYPNKQWADISKICREFKDFTYKVYPIVIYRNRKFTAMSQVRQGHVKTIKEADINISKAYEHIFSELAKIRLIPIIVKYEHLVADKMYREYIFEYILSLEYPHEFEFFNANDKYKTE